jgi:adenylosuccinate lyase
MLELWSPRTRYGLWRRLWLILAESQKKLGVEIPDDALSQMRSHLDDIDFDAVSAYERRFRHDVMAHVHAFGDAAPTAKPFIHLGATSAYVTDNADLILMRRGLELLRGTLLNVLSALASFARQWKNEATLGYTHLQPAQLTTVGKRATLWMQDIVLDVTNLDHRVATLPLRGVKGTTGTQATFLEIFNGDHKKVRELDRLVTAAMDFQSSLPVTGQTYTRKIDASILGILAGIAASASKFSGDIRMLQSFGEIEEPFESDQIGSSAMAYKRNPMRSERIAGLSRFVMSIEPNANQTHSVQFFERTLDDSANRRLVIPESFLSTEANHILMSTVSLGLQVNRNRISQRVRSELPFMATERLIVRAVNKGVDRQDAHEIVRRHSMEVTASMRAGAEANDLLERLGDDSGLKLSKAELDDAADPNAFVGRAPQQVDEFLSEIVEPLLAGHETTTSGELRV